MFKRSLQLPLFACLVIAASWAANDPFVGDWKLNPSKSRLTDVMKVEKIGPNKYAFDLAGDGNAETIMIDGTDQPGTSGTTLSVTAESPNAWKVGRKKDGRMLITANWKLSQDGNTLTDNFNAITPSGSTSTLDYVYQRKGTGSGFAGTWVSTSEAVKFVYVIKIRPYEEHGLSVTDSTSQQTMNMRLDGKDYPKMGTNAAIVDARSSRRLDEHTLELTDKRNGKVYIAQHYKLSPDLNTLTLTMNRTGRSEPQIFVFERQ